MKNTILKSALLVGTTIIILSCGLPLPEGWFRAGSAPKSYDMGIDKGAGQYGKNAATIKSLDEKIDGFGTLMQDCLPAKYLGKRIRMTGYMKSNDVNDWAAFWLRVDNNLSFDNMHDGEKDRSIKGTTDWTKYEIVLDVPSTATNIAYGALLSGTGQIWFTDLNFEIVDNSVPVTRGSANMTKSEPTNLDFSK